MKNNALIEAEIDTANVPPIKSQNNRVAAYNKNIREQLLKEILAATDSIAIAMCYFNDKNLLQLLCIKAFAGIEVNIVVDSNKINKKFMSSLQDAAALGCGIFWNKARNLMHHKYLIVDGVKLITGSYNMTNAAPNNMENIVVINADNELINVYSKSFVEALSTSVQIKNDRIGGANRFITPFMKGRLNIDNLGPISTQDSKSNRALIIDYNWNPFKLIYLKIKDVFDYDMLGKRAELLFKNYPELTYLLSYISLPIIIECEYCDQKTIYSWFRLHAYTECSCSRKNTATVSLN